MEIAAASSSSSSPSFLNSEPYFIYDVFISHSGDEISRNFVSHLHNVLLQAQVQTLVDEGNLQEGMNLEEHMRAISKSKIIIIVFSKTYIESACSFLEFVKIIECHKTFGKIVLPVFYQIDPFGGERYFGKALEADARKSYSEEQLEYALSWWVCAVTTAADINGWDVRDFRHDDELVKLIARRVQTLLDYKELFITRFPVGLDSHVKKVIGCIENHSTKVCIIGIWGMGGSGKTTIAKAIYNRIYREFIGKSFIENIREDWYNNPVHLQENLLYDVLKSKIEVKRIELGRTMIENELSRKKLLIVLDDVNEFKQLQYLCGNCEWVGQGSVIIITTRDVRLLNLLEVTYVFKMDDMNENESLELFSWHAFGEAKPRKDLNELARNIVAYCGGLPLALEVLGSYLRDRTKEQWKSVFSKLKIIPNYEVLHNLRASFDDLHDDTEREIFLDVCCFFIGKERGYVTQILNGCGLHADIGIRVLIERDLIKVEKNNKLEMHPLLRDMGREIIRQGYPKKPGKRSRLWFQEDVIEVLKKNTGTKAIEGLSVKLQLNSRYCFEAHAFEKMKRLKLLQLDHVQLTGDYGYLSKQLRWICWKGFPSKYISNNFHMENVIGIDLKHSHLQLVWKESQVLKWLKFLNLSHSKYLTETPDFSGLPSLEKLILKDCPSLCKVHQSIGDLCNLLLINLKDCTSLSSLPREVYKLKSLRTFILSGCFKIHIMEEDIVQMESLITLVTENTAVKQVPCSIVSSKSIGYISLRRFEGLSNSIFPSIIQYWISPTMNPESYIRPFCMDIENYYLRDLPPLHKSLANIRSVLVQCDAEFQLSKQVKTILVEYGVNFTESRLSNRGLRFSLIGAGRYNEFFSTLRDSVSEGLACSESCEVSLPGDNHPYWLSHVGEGHSVCFNLPKDCDMKGMILCVIYLSTPEIVAAECLRSVLIVNYTKCTLQIHKHDTLIPFNDIDWKVIISNLGCGDRVEIFLTFGHGLMVKNTAVYLICGQSNDLEMESCPEPNENTLNNFIKKMVMCDFWTSIRWG